MLCKTVYTDSVFREKEIPWCNVVAFESDNCNVMKGKNKGVLGRIKKVNGRVIDYGCICHLTNLCNQAAMKALPLDVDELLVNIYFHFDKR